MHNFLDPTISRGGVVKKNDAFFFIFLNLGCKIFPSHTKSRACFKIPNTVKVEIFAVHSRKFSKREFKNPRKYLQYFVCTFWTRRSCVLTICVDANGLYTQVCDLLCFCAIPSYIHTFNVSFIE